MIKNNSKNIGTPISKLGVPEQTLIAMVNRHGEALFPDDDFVLAEEDHVLVFTLKGKLPEVENFSFRIQCAGLILSLTGTLVAFSVYLFWYQ